MALFRMPRVVRLVEVASRAELLRRQRQVRGAALRAALSAAAAVFALLLLLGLHIAAWAALVPLLGPVGAALAVGALDLAVLLALARFAARRRADPASDEAAAVRDAALRGARAELLTLGSLLGPSGADDEAPGPRGRRVRVYPPRPGDPP